MNKRIWVVVESTSREIIEKASSYKDACDMVTAYEKADIRANCFRPNTYEIVSKYTDENESNLLLNEYQVEALKTAIYPENYSIIYPTLGLAGEAGEVADKVKKVIRDNKGKFTDSIRKDIALELGDVLWYVAVLSDRLGFKLSEIGEMNNEKLRNRVKNGTINGSGDNR